jgi:hypothetical protein
MLDRIGFDLWASTIAESSSKVYLLFGIFSVDELPGFLTLPIAEKKNK